MARRYLDEQRIIEDYIVPNDKIRARKDFVEVVEKPFYGPNIKYLYDYVFTDNKGNPYYYMDKGIVDNNWKFDKIPFTEEDKENFKNKVRNREEINKLKYILGNKRRTLSSGGGIYIKPSHRGRLTELKARTGKSEAELYNNGNPAHKKMVVFARNARKWKH